MKLPCLIAARSSDLTAEKRVLSSTRSLSVWPSRVSTSTALPLTADTVPLMRLGAAFCADDSRGSASKATASKDSTLERLDMTIPFMNEKRQSSTGLKMPLSGRRGRKKSSLCGLQKLLDVLLDVLFMHCCQSAQ